jgi:hypothetical protein
MRKYLNLPFVITLAIALLLLLAFVNLLVPSRNSSVSTISAPERAAELAAQGKREQVITFNSGLVALQETTTANNAPPANLFAIGVGQVSLGEPQPIGQSSGSSFGRLGRAYGTVGSSMVDKGNVTIFGPFNNLLIYDKRSGALTKVFDTRVSVTNFRWISRVSPRVIAIIATSDDSNRDGKLTYDDLQQLFLYAIDDRQLRRVSGLNASVDDVANIDEVSYLVVEASVDTDKNGKIARGTYGSDVVPEPSALFRVDLKTFAATPLIDKALLDELQETLQGTRPAPAVPPTK